MSGGLNDIEPSALDAPIVVGPEGVPALALVSIAISMKRIADALDGTTLGVDISESLCGLGAQS